MPVHPHVDDSEGDYVLYAHVLYWSFSLLHVLEKLDNRGTCASGFVQVYRNKRRA